MIICLIYVGCSNDNKVTLYNLADAYYLCEISHDDLVEVANFHNNKVMIY